MQIKPSQQLIEKSWEELKTIHQASYSKTLYYTYAKTNADWMLAEQWASEKEAGLHSPKKSH